MKKSIALILAAAFCTLGNVQASAENFIIKRVAADEEIWLDLPVLDMPYHNTASDLKGGFFNAYGNQSMATTIAIAQDAYDAAHYGLRTLFNDKWYSRFAIWAFDWVAQMVPFGLSWAHEEYHRAVMTNGGVDSFDEVWLFKFSGTTMNVSHETDEALAYFHDNNFQSFIRMNTAGAEAQTHLAQLTQRNDFFYHRTLYNGFNYLVGLVNNIAYVSTCKDKVTDDDVIEMINSEPDMKARDFTGMDFTAWAYELYHPGNRYSDRGPHPLGNGIQRYILYDQIGEEGLEYIQRQSWMEALNLLTPMIVGMNRFKLKSTDKGDWYGNFSFRHYMTNFGDDSSIDLLLETPNWKLYGAPHIYSNKEHVFAGVEAGFVDKRFFQDRLKLDASAQLWSQPETFYSESGKFGGRIAVDAKCSFGRVEPYASLSYKTAGWQAGNVYLDQNFSFRMGLRWRMNK